MAAAAVLQGLLSDELRLAEGDPARDPAGESDSAAGEGASAVAVLADGMDDAASRAFGALPERLAVLVPYRGGWKLAFLGGKGPDAYSVDACREALLEILALPNLV